MVREIMKDPFFLGQKSEPATKEDAAIGRDLMDTLRAHRDGCVGMAANMIGIRKNIIIVNMGIMDMVSCSIRESSRHKNPSRRKRDASPLPVSAKPPDTKKSRWNSGTWIGSCSGERSPAGLHRLSSMKWTTATALSSNQKDFTATLRSPFHVPYFSSSESEASNSIGLIGYS